MASRQRDGVEERPPRAMDILQAVLDKAAASDGTRFGAIGLLTNLERLVSISGTRQSSESPGIAKASVQSQIETVLLRTISALIQGKDPFPAVFPWCPSSLSFRGIRMRGRRGISSMRRCTWIWKARPGSRTHWNAPSSHDSAGVVADSRAERRRSSNFATRRLL